MISRRVAVIGAGPSGLVAVKELLERGHRPVCFERFLSTFSPEAGGSIGFIGFVRPGFGAIPPLAELQARWFARIQSGECALPSRAEQAGCKPSKKILSGESPRLRFKFHTGPFVAAQYRSAGPGALPPAGL